MSIAATIYTVHVDLADMDRQVFETLDLRLARHPSETAEFMVVRVLAFCLEYVDGLRFSDGVSAGDEPAVLARDLMGRLTHWIEVGVPAPARLHRAGKAAARVAVYTHRDVRQFLGQFHGERIHRADEIVVRAFDRAAIERVAALVERRCAFALSVSENELTLSFDRATEVVSMTEHRLPQD